MPEPTSEWDDDFRPQAKPAADRSLAQLRDDLRGRLLAGESYLPFVEDLRLFIMARFYQAPPEEIVAELVGWGLEPEFSTELVRSALATDRYDKRAEHARQLAAADDPGRPANPTLAAMCQPQSPRANPGSTHIPDVCPDCDRVLYPVARLRPAPSLSRPARSLLLAGCAVSAFCYIFGLMAVRLAVGVPVPHWAVGILWFPLALLPALTSGALAYRLPRVVRLRCRGCGWRRTCAVRSPSGPGRTTAR